MMDFEDMSNAFACTSANCRAEVLEKLINETDRPMFFERVLNSTVRYDSDEEHFFNQGPDLLLGRVCSADYSVEHADDGVGGGAFADTAGTGTVRTGVRSGTVGSRR